MYFSNLYKYSIEYYSKFKMHFMLNSVINFELFFWGSHLIALIIKMIKAYISILKIAIYYTLLTLIIRYSILENNILGAILLLYFSWHLT